MVLRKTIHYYSRYVMSMRREKKEKEKEKNVIA